MHTVQYRTFRAGQQAYRRTHVDTGGDTWSSLPYSLRVLAESTARTVARPGGDVAAVEAVLARRTGTAVPLFPARLLLQDLLGVPLLTDLAALRDAVADSGGDPRAVTAQLPVDFVVDHSLIVDSWASTSAQVLNLQLEHERNRERFAFLRWCEEQFDSLRIIPPGKGIMHQINVERLSRVVWSDAADDGLPPLAYPDMVLGTDSHTPMVNGIGVLGWGVGGIEAESAMLGRPVSFALPEVVGVELRGRLEPAITPTDLVLRVTELLRHTGVIGAFVEFFGPGLATLSTSDRATIANMAPEQGATASFFPVDARTIEFLRASGRSEQQVALVEAYCRSADLWWEPEAPVPEYDRVVSLDLSTVRPSLAGPRRPQDRVDLADAPASFAAHLAAETQRTAPARTSFGSAGAGIADGAVLIAAIASCTNTSSPRGMATAGLVARNAVARGLRTAPWVKTSLTPGSQVIAAMLTEAGLQDDFDALGFHVAGFGCATCNGNSGPLDPAVSAAVDRADLVGVAVVSSNRNFAGRVHPDVRAAYLASPALTVAYALAGTMTTDLTTAGLGVGADGRPVTLAELWPTEQEIDAVVAGSLRPDMFTTGYESLFDGGPVWNALSLPDTVQYPWDERSTYLRRPPYFDGLDLRPQALRAVTAARILVVLGDNINTDDISPSGAISKGSAAALHLEEHGVGEREYNSYGTRRGNYEVAVRSLFANKRLRNHMVPGVEGSLTTIHPEGVTMSIFEAASEYRRRGVPLVVFAGRDYGAGSSRDWAAKAPALVGVRAVVAGGFERIHRSNLIGMGILPLELPEGTDTSSLGIDGSEVVDIALPDEGLEPRGTVRLTITARDGDAREVAVTCRADTQDEVDLLRHGGLLPTVWRDLMAGLRSPVAAS